MEAIREIIFETGILGREGDKTRNVHLGNARKMDAAEARQKARERKAEALGMQIQGS